MTTTEERYIHPECVTDDHTWQPWFYWGSLDRWTRVCARWNCEGREEINGAGVAS